jgi:hypothetical protein
MSNMNSADAPMRYAGGATPTLSMTLDYLSPAR